MTDALLTTLLDTERVKFGLVVIVAGRAKRRGISLRVHKRLFQRALRARDQPGFDLVVAGLVVTAGEITQRQLIERLLRPKVCGIPVRPERPRNHLFNIIDPRIKGEENSSLVKGQKKRPRVKGEEKKQMLDQFEFAINQALKAFKVKIGLPEESFQAFCHTLTEDVIESAVTEACREYLEINARSCPHVLSGDLPQFLDILATKFPKDVDVVEQALKTSRTRDHLAAISVTGDGDQLNVTLVNSAGARITMKAWRFLQLMTHPEQPIQLGEFPDPRRYQEPEVIFNNQRKGVVHGMFSPQHASIEIMCIDPDRSGVNALHDRVIIAIDLDYALCIAVVLNRLHQDQERVSRLMQELLTNAVDDKHRQLFTLN